MMKALRFSVSLVVCYELSIICPTMAFGQYRDDVVRDALLAQVSGMGKCLDLDLVDTLPSAHFPDVLFLRTRCLTEHEERILEAVAGIDRSGVVFQLGFESGFDFLALRHPPTSVDSVHAVEYFVEALRYMGVLPWNAKAVNSEAALSGSAASAVRVSDVRLEPPIVVHRGGRTFRVHVSIETPESLRRIEGAIRNSGRVSVFRQIILVEW